MGVLCYDAGLDEFPEGRLRVVKKNQQIVFVVTVIGHVLVR